MNKVILGWREWLSLPGLGIENIKAKVDTGARTSALHTFELESFSEDGIAKVRFCIHPYQHDLSIVKQCTVDLLDERNVTDSGGHTELRPVISTPICLGGITQDINITLTNRENEAPVIAPNTGIIIGRTNLPLVHEGDALVHLARFRNTDTATEAVDQFQSELDPEENESVSGTDPIV